MRDTDLDDVVTRCDDDLRRMSGAELLVTGGAGFLGYYLVQAPLRWNERHPDEPPIAVTVYDSYLRGVPDWLGGLEGRPDLTVTRYDMREPLPGDVGRFRWVMHAAGVASPTYYRANPIATMDANVTGLRTLLDAAADRAGTPDALSGMVFFSSSEIYGDPDPSAIPTPETYRGLVSCTGPRACYDESKRYGETLCVTFARQLGLPVRIVRPFNNYGPGMKLTDGRVIADLCRDALAGRPLTLLSDGNPTRTFCYVADAVVGYYRALVRGGDGEPYNIGTAEPEVSVGELAESVARAVKELYGTAVDVRHGRSDEPDYLVDNPDRRCPDVSKARDALGYEARTDLDEGLRRTLVWSAGHPGGSAA